MGLQGDGRKAHRAAWAGVTAATAVVCVAGVLLAPGVAYADSSMPKPAPEPGQAETDAPGTEEDRSRDEAREQEEARELEEVRKRIDGLYRKAEAATEAYNASRARSQKQSRKIEEIRRQAAKTRKQLETLREQAGSLARAQYRRGLVPTELRMLLSDEPEHFFRDVGLARKGQQATKGLLSTLAHTERELDGYARSASVQWHKLEDNRKKKAAAKKEIKKKLEAAKEIESELADGELAKLLKLEEEAALRAQAKWLDSGVLQEIDAKASKRGKKAITFATDQLGKYYEWGAEGPRTYDCSGLTLKAWAAAGRTIPRTSQEQWRRLPRIDIEDMRPGDLIIYHQDASHVGMYVGDGAIVHAPRPGRQITAAGAGSMRILGVVRPDN